VGEVERIGDLLYGQTSDEEWTTGREKKGASKKGPAAKIHDTADQDHDEMFQSKVRH
jgi:hypothetical protein